MKEGKVIFFAAKRGFGFVKADDGEEYFFHRSGIVDGRPQKGDRVIFNISRPMAIDLVVENPNNT